MLTTHVAKDEESWDAFVRQHGGGFLQSWGWSRFQEAVGRQAYRFRITAASADAPPEAAGETVGQFLTIVHKLPFGARYAYIPRGPVIMSAAAGGSDNFDAFIGTLRETLSRLGCIFARVELPFLQTGGLVSAADLERHGFHYVRSVQPADTLIVDLDKSEEDLLAAMHPKTRYNIRVAQKHGVSLREADYVDADRLRQDVGVFWRLLGETATRDKFHTHPQGYYEKMLEALAPSRGGDLQVRLVFAEHGGEAVAACLVAEFGGTLTYLHGASSSAHRNVMAPQLLHWMLMSEAKRRGFDRYDLWGVAPGDDIEHPWAGITRFKKGFGGRRESYLGAWELSIDPFWYTLYRFAKRFRNV
jgi:lipid II:glycine glycyltransferase (peptidoglycan interpeptide bridge formation enzyme)